MAVRFEAGDCRHERDSERIRAPRDGYASVTRPGAARPGRADCSRYLFRLCELDAGQRAVERRDLKSLETFAFRAIPSVNKRLVLELRIYWSSDRCVASRGRRWLSHDGDLV